MKEYTLYEEMKMAHEDYSAEAGVFAEKNAQFIRAASMLARMDTENPFSDTSDAALVYDDFIYFYKKWPKSKNDCAFKNAFLRKAEALCEYDNPFIADDSKSVEQMKEAEYKKTEENDVKTGTYKPIAKKIFGIKD